MVILTATEAAEVRQQMARGVVPLTWTKGQCDTALQAIEDWFEANRPSLAAAMEAAAPGIFVAVQKKRMVAYYLLQKFRREGV